MKSAILSELESLGSLKLKIKFSKKKRNEIDLNFFVSNKEIARKRSDWEESECTRKTQ